jgi:hypothetical protein
MARALVCAHLGAQEDRGVEVGRGLAGGGPSSACTASGAAARGRRGGCGQPRTMARSNVRARYGGFFGLTRLLRLKLGFFGFFGLNSLLSRKLEKDVPPIAACALHPPRGPLPSGPTSQCGKKSPIQFLPKLMSSAARPPIGPGPPSGQASHRARPRIRHRKLEKAERSGAVPKKLCFLKRPPWTTRGPTLPAAGDCRRLGVWAFGRQMGVQGPTTDGGSR